MPSWKNVQSKKKLKQQTKLALFVLGSILTLILISQIINFSKTLFSPWKITTQRSYTWDGKFNINFLIRSKNLSLVSYNPTDKKIIIVDIPDETYLEAAHGFGKWQLRSIFDLGGLNLLKETMQDFFAAPIDGFLDFSGSFKDKSASEIVDFLRSNPLGGLNMLSNLKTDLTLFELIKLKFGLSSVRFDKIVKINLRSNGVLLKDKLLDGTEILVADPNKLDVSLIDLADPSLKNEHKTVALFNATEKGLFAQKWSRLITNMGGDVIITSNAKNISDKTYVVGEKSNTYVRLSQVFKSKCKAQDCDKIQKSDEDLTSSRGQINIKLGLDLVN